MDGIKTDTVLNETSEIEQDLHAFSPTEGESAPAPI